MLRVVLSHRPNAISDEDEVHQVDQIENNERTVEKRSLDSSVLSQDEQPAAKVQRFELGTAESAENEWSLRTSMVEYIHRYMNANIPAKEIKEKILSLNPVPSNIKRVPELDSYIKPNQQPNI